MSDSAVEAFLRDQGTGVLSLATDNRAYGVPVSFAYLGSDRCLLDLGFGPNSTKRTMIEATETACLTAHEWTSPVRWQSVVMFGLLEERDALDPDEEQRFFDQAADVEISVFGASPETVELRWFDFRIEEITGREAP